MEKVAIPAVVVGCILGVIGWLGFAVYAGATAGIIVAFVGVLGVAWCSAR